MFISHTFHYRSIHCKTMAKRMPHSGVRARYIFENENIDLNSLKACRNPTIQIVTEHHTASTDRWCKYLNGYATVQHRSASWILNPQSSKLETQTLRLKTWSSHLETRSVRASRCEDQVSSFQLQVSTYFWQYCKYNSVYTWLKKHCLLRSIHHKQWGFKDLWV